MVARQFPRVLGTKKMDQEQLPDMCYPFISGFGQLAYSSNTFKHKMEKIHLYDKILSPMVTEKSTNLSEQNKIVFRVPRAANKTNLKKNIEKIFKVNVTKINIVNKQNRSVVKRGKKVNVQGYKKAIITLKKGQSIDLTTGI